MAGALAPGTAPVPRACARSSISASTWPLVTVVAILEP